MDYNKFQLALFSCADDRQTNTDNKGVMSMIPALAIAAYLLNAKYDDLKSFYWKNQKLCLRYEKLFEMDYEKYLEILNIIKNTDIIEKLKTIDPNGTYNIVNPNKPLEYHKFINKYIAEILKLHDIIMTGNDQIVSTNHIYYNLEFVSGKISTTDKMVTDQLFKKIKSLKKNHRNIIESINVLVSPENYLAATIYIKPSFNIKEFLKVMDRLKKEFNAQYNYN